MLSRWARGICCVLLVAAASGAVMAPAKPGLALSMSAPEVRRKSPGGFGRLKRTRGNVAETASLLDDSDEDILDFCGVSRRAFWLAMVWALPVSLAPLAILIQPFRSAVWYRILAIALAKSGAAFIKWGQWAAVRPDMFPLRLCSVLSHLHSDAPRHSWDHTLKTLKATLGSDALDYFDDIERNAIASGSIAQVHVAHLEGHKVAVKVRHPGVRRQIALDFHIMKSVAKFVSYIPGMSWLNLEASMEQFSDTIAGQTRLDVEGDNLDQFVNNFKYQRQWCGFPRVVLKSPALLVESFEEGQLASKYVAPFRRYRNFLERRKSEAQGGASKGWLSRACGWCVSCFGLRGSDEEEWDEDEYIDLSLGQTVVSRGADMYLQMLLKDNLMHADLHPGNILVQDKAAQMDPLESDGSRMPSDSSSTRIVLVDAGMVARLARKEQSAFIGFLQALGEGDGRRAGDCVLGWSEKQTCTGKAETEAFRQEMDEIFKVYCRGYGTNVSVGQVLIEVLQCIRLHKVRIDVNYATLVINVLCLHGLGEVLQPNYNILDAAKPLLKVYRANPVWQVALRAAVFPMALRVKKLQDHVVYKRMRRDMDRERGVESEGVGGVVMGAVKPVVISLAMLASLALAAPQQQEGMMQGKGGQGGQGGLAVVANILRMTLDGFGLGPVSVGTEGGEGGGGESKEVVESGMRERRFFKSRR